MLNHPVVMRGRCRASASSEHRDVGEKSPQRRNQTPNQRDRGVNISSADVPGPAAEPPSPLRCLPSPWSWSPLLLGESVASPAEGTNEADRRETRRCGTKARRSRGVRARRRAAKVPNTEWRRAGVFGVGEGRRDWSEQRKRRREQNEREGAPRVSKPNDVRACVRGREGVGGYTDD